MLIPLFRFVFLHSPYPVMNSLDEFEKQGCEFNNQEKAKFVTSLMNTLCMSSDVSKIMGN